MAANVVLADLAEPEHAAALLEALDGFALDPMGAGRPLEPRVRARLVDGLRAHPTTLVWLAFDGTRVVGMALCFRGFSSFRAAPLVNVHDLFVATSHRGTGLGRALLGAVESWARANGCCKLTLEVVEENRTARAVYDRCGFGKVAPGEPQSTTLHLEKTLAP